VGNRGTRTIPGKLRSDVADVPACSVGTFANRPLPRFAGRLYYATDSAILFIDTGSAWVDTRQRMVAHRESLITVVNTTTETNLVSATVPAGTLAAGDALKLRAYGDYANTATGSLTYQMRLYWGPPGGETLILDTGAKPNVANIAAQRGKWYVEAMLHAESNTVHHASAIFALGQTADANAWGSGIHSNPVANPGAHIGYGVATEDLTVANGLLLQVGMSAARATSDIRCMGFTLEKINA